MSHGADIFDSMSHMVMDSTHQLFFFFFVCIHLLLVCMCVCVCVRVCIYVRVRVRVWSNWVVPQHLRQSDVDKVSQLLQSLPWVH